MAASEWENAIKAGHYEGSEVDLSDGFIHFSTGTQVEETVAKHFREQTDLVLICFNSDDFGDVLKWEPSRGGELFPHLYAQLDPAKNIAVHKLGDLPNGGHKFPEAY